MLVFNLLHLKYPFVLHLVWLVIPWECHCIGYCRK